MLTIPNTSFAKNFGRAAFACSMIAFAAFINASDSVDVLAAANQAKVLSVIDGDTLNIDRGAGKERVILFGVDCPELSQPAGDEARKFTDERCWRKTVGVEEMGKDRGGRVIAVIHLPDGKSLNEELVRHGLAWWSDKYAPNNDKLKGLQSAAQIGKVGLWSQTKPVAPWIWRNGQRSTEAKILPVSH